jgi:hypothetical protein
VQYAVGRHPEITDVPAVVNLGETDEQRQILTLYASGSDIGRAIVAPPGVPTATVVALRTAFVAAMTSPALLADVQKSGTDIDPLAGDRLQEIVRASVSVPPDIVAQAKRLSAPAR